MHSEEVTVFYDETGKNHKELKVTMFLSDLRSRVAKEILNTISKEVNKEKIGLKLAIDPVAVFFIDLGEE